MRSINRLWKKFQPLSYIGNDLLEYSVENILDYVKTIEKNPIITKSAKIEACHVCSILGNLQSSLQTLLYGVVEFVEVYLWKSSFIKKSRKIKFL